MVQYKMLSGSWLFLFILVISFNSVHVETPEKQIPLTKGFNANVGPTLKFFYCYSCGYRKVFDDYANILQQKYPDISIHGSNYDPPGVQMLIAKVLSLGKFLIIICVIAGINIFRYVGQEQPGWWIWCIDNKLYSCMMIFFLCNAIEGQMVSTGAFEISLDGMPVWSKLETGRIPQPPELFQIIDNHLQFDEPINIKQPGFTK